MGFSWIWKITSSVQYHSRVSILYHYLLVFVVGDVSGIDRGGKESGNSQLIQLREDFECFQNRDDKCLRFLYTNCHKVIYIVLKYHNLLHKYFCHIICQLK
jgi:hypothetical protein